MCQVSGHEPRTPKNWDYKGLERSHWQRPGWAELHFAACGLGGVAVCNSLNKKTGGPGPRTHKGRASNLWEALYLLVGDRGLEPRTSAV